jgi:hypothetical protein
MAIAENVKENTNVLLFCSQGKDGGVAMVAGRRQR